MTRRVIGRARRVTHWAVGAAVAALAGLALQDRATAGSGDSPKPTVELRVSVKGKAVAAEESVELRLGEKAQLKVEMVRKNGQVVDVTTNPKTSYFSLTSWSTSASPSGLVTATSALRDLVKAAGRDSGAVVITYGQVGDDEIGFATVTFEVVG